VLEFGIFDHLDSNGLPLRDFFEQRLSLIELIERSGFYGHHLAEHHSTPLGLAGSPSVFLASAFARTKNLRLGTLVYVLPLHHPLRLYEEVCMLDHLSGGRLMLGVGRGGALIEHQRMGVEPKNAQALYHEAFAVLMHAFENDVVNFDGKFFQYRDYLVQQRPLQRPHPPIWYGAPNPEAIGWAAPRSINVVSLGPATRARAIAERYRTEWSALGRDPATLPKIGVTRHVVVAPTDDEAKRIARRVYTRWSNAIAFLWEHAGQDFVLKEIYPRDFDALEQLGHGIAGSPTSVRDYLAELQRETGVNYVLCQMIFGDMRFDEAQQSISLFARDVMPAFSGSVSG
jgi:alkanesulfonate monooxygenase SsuD/methylene tetrahydromethanopterin reductase-like flavin-dependent oxidoreductase (luciferase family)